MTGSNTMTLNQATMQEAMHHWLTRVILNADSPDMKVTNVKHNSSVDTFDIEFEDIVDGNGDVDSHPRAPE